MKWWILAACIGGSVLASGCSGLPGGTADAPARLENGSFAAELNGFSIHYEVHGNGPVVMTLPNSWGLSVEGLRNMYLPLEERLTMVHFDPRGIGGSDPVREDADMGLAAVRADFDALRRHLGLERVAAMGWSNGAVNLVLLAAECPGTLSEAIFVHGLASFTDEDERIWAETYAEVVAGFEKLVERLSFPSVPLEEKTAGMKAYWLENYFPASTADPGTMRPRLLEVFGPARFSWAHANYSQQEAPTIDVRDRLESITARSLVIAGRHDMVPVEKARELADGIIGSSLVVFENSGHFAPLEEPEAFRAEVFRFLGVEGQPDG